MTAILAADGSDQVFFPAITDRSPLFIASSVREYYENGIKPNLCSIQYLMKSF